MKLRFLLSFLLSLVLISTLAGCSASAAPAISIESAWGRPSPTMSGVGGVYMGINLVTEPVTIPANGQVELKSGDLHIMCMMMKNDQFKAGSKIDLTLAFEKSGEKTVSVDVREE